MSASGLLPYIVASGALLTVQMCQLPPLLPLDTSSYKEKDGSKRSETDLSSSIRTDRVS